MSKLQGKIAVVTGGNSGIGLATAKRFVEEGAYVFIIGRRQAELDKAVKEIGRNVTAVQGDVTNLNDLDRLYATVKETKGVIDVLFANAGFVELKTIDQISPAHFDKTFDINTKGLLFTVQKALPLMRQGGSIILVSSIANSKAMPSYTAYSASKAAIRSFARTWTLELKDRGIRVNTLSPGPVDTPIIDLQFPTREETDKLRETFAQAIPLGRLGRPEELASAALFLASDDSSFVAGIDLPVDGGMAQI
ncbi:SDR family NAD(P)-dependent oxidoreductase [Herbaspirillum sp. NPDC101397]|uniref:SDR family NAD(P)-dependent oxidoreductase n=1 Tax=Herbaspirillum sp. NPDC101397 TaxID=3364006 RepID=UPI00383A9678